MSLGVGTGGGGVCIRLGNSKLRKIFGRLGDGGCRLESVQGESRFEQKSVCQSPLSEII